MRSATQPWLQRKLDMSLTLLANTQIAGRIKLPFSNLGTNLLFWDFSDTLDKQSQGYNFTFLASPLPHIQY